MTWVRVEYIDVYKVDTRPPVMTKLLLAASHYAADKGYHFDTVRLEEWDRLYVKIHTRCREPPPKCDTDKVMSFEIRLKAAMYDDYLSMSVAVRSNDKSEAERIAREFRHYIRECIAKLVVEEAGGNEPKREVGGVQGSNEGGTTD